MGDQHPSHAGLAARASALERCTSNAARTSPPTTAPERRASISSHTPVSSLPFRALRSVGRVRRSPSRAPRSVGAAADRVLRATYGAHATRHAREGIPEESGCEKGFSPSLVGSAPRTNPLVSLPAPAGATIPSRGWSEAEPVVTNPSHRFLSLWCERGFSHQRHKLAPAKHTVHRCADEQWHPTP